MSATTYIMNRLKNKYHCIDQHPTKYKDVNEELQEMKNEKSLILKSCLAIIKV